MNSFNHDIIVDNVKALIQKERDSGVKLNQIDLADKIGINRARFSRILNKKQKTELFTLPQIIAIADYFNVSLDYLFGRETDEPSNKIICRIIVKLFENRYLQSTDYKTKETKWLVNTQYEEGDPLSFVKKTNPVVYKALYLQNYIQDEDPDYQRTGNDIVKNIEINKFIEYYLSLKEMKENGIMDENIFKTSISNYIENMKY